MQAQEEGLEGQEEAQEEEKQEGEEDQSQEEVEVKQPQQNAQEMQCLLPLKLDDAETRSFQLYVWFSVDSRNCSDGFALCSEGRRPPRIFY